MKETKHLTPVRHEPSTSRSSLSDALSIVPFSSGKLRCEGVSHTTYRLSERGRGKG